MTNTICRRDADFAAQCVELARNAHSDYRFSDRKIFIACLLGMNSTPEQDLAFKDELVRLHRIGALVLARADLVAAMDAEMVALSEIVADGAEFHFLVIS
jgi:hypothetical protein